MNIAIITAAGTGTRMKLDVPKQFYEINKKPLILYTLESFQSMNCIDYICIAYLDGYKNYFEKLIKANNLFKVKLLVAGGETNQLSIFNCLKELSFVATEKDIIIVHDGIRPLISEQVVSDNIEICKKHKNAVAVVPSNEAMLYSENKSSSNSSINRDFVWKTQTPHSMYYKDMFNLVNSMIKKGHTNSVAICTMLIESGQTVHFSKGSNLNFKLTSPEDIELFKGIINCLEKK